jgi:hypothetical protein
MAVLGEGGMIRNPVFKVEVAEPAIGKIQRHFFAQSTLRPDAVAISDYKHSHHQFWIDRGAAGVAIEKSQIIMNVSQGLRHEDINPAQQMACGNPLIKIERVEKLSLISSLTSHHGVHPPNHFGKENHDSAYNSTEFFNSIDPERTWQPISSKFESLMGRGEQT